MLDKVTRDQATQRLGISTRTLGRDAPSQGRSSARRPTSDGSTCFSTLTTR